MAQQEGPIALAGYTILCVNTATKSEGVNNKPRKRKDAKIKLPGNKTKTSSMGGHFRISKNLKLLNALSLSQG